MKFRRVLKIGAVVAGGCLAALAWQGIAPGQNGTVQGNGAGQGRGVEQGIARAATAALPAMPNQDGQDFGGKVLSIHIQYPEKGAGHTLKDVHAREVGGHSFLVGTGVSAGPKPNPYDGRKIWVSVDKIIQIVEYKDLDEMQKAYAQFHPMEP